ncbi:MAG: tetratricopeptide repeat protein [Limisphaerales bacterium]
MVRDSIMEPGTENRAKLASELCEKGLWREMLAFAQKWREENAADYRAYYYLGLGLTGLHKFSQAEVAYRRALAINPGDFEVWNGLAELLYRNLRRQADGIQCLEQAMKINPRHKLGWLNLATLNGRMGCHDKALECADRAIALDQKFVEAHLSRAAAARALGKMDILQEVCHELATLEPENFRRVS